MTTIANRKPRANDPEDAARRARGEQLLDMVRAEKYAEVMRKGALVRHKIDCRKCRPARRCGQFRYLEGRVQLAADTLADLRQQLEQLDAEQLAAEAQKQARTEPTGTLELF